MIPTRALRNALSTAESVAKNFMNKHGSHSHVRTQQLDGNQLRLLSLSLNRPLLHKDLSVVDRAPEAGTPIPPGYHLVYFTPAVLEEELTKAGSEGPYNADEPFSRRMWAGGNLQWNTRPDRALRVGDQVQETTKALSARATKTKNGEDMVVVSVEKVFETERGVALIDNRQWLFRKAFEPSIQPVSSPISYKDVNLPPAPSNKFSRDFVQSSVALFRFSALTFNPHKIHWYTPWTREVEGHRDLVVHGPLNLVNTLDVWRDFYATKQTANDTLVPCPKSMEYRLTAPVYVDEPYRITQSAKEGEDGIVDGVLSDAGGTIGMRVTIVDP